MISSTGAREESLLAGCGRECEVDRGPTGQSYEMTEALESYVTAHFRMGRIAELPQGSMRVRMLLIAERRSVARTGAVAQERAQSERSVDSPA